VRGAPTRVGQVLQVGTVGSGVRYYLVRADGIMRVTQTEAGLVLGNPANRAAYPSGQPHPWRVTPYDIAAAPVSAHLPATGYPDRVPRLITPPARGAAVCAQGDGLHGTVLFVSPRVPLPAAADTAPGSPDPLVADQVYVPPSAGALVAAVQSPGGPAGTTYLITAQVPGCR
jgi:hypothetical protein